LLHPSQTSTHPSNVATTTCHFFLSPWRWDAERSPPIWPGCGRHHHCQAAGLYSGIDITIVKQQGFTAASTSPLSSSRRNSGIDITIVKQQA